MKNSAFLTWFRIWWFGLTKYLEWLLTMSHIFKRFIYRVITLEWLAIIIHKHNRLPLNTANLVLQTVLVWLDYYWLLLLALSTGVSGCVRGRHSQETGPWMIQRFQSAAKVLFNSHFPFVTILSFKSLKQIKTVRWLYCIINDRQASLKCSLKSYKTFR